VVVAALAANVEQRDLVSVERIAFAARSQRAADRISEVQVSGSQCGISINLRAAWLKSFNY